jgi:hypothetical protein
VVGQVWFADEALVVGDVGECEWCTVLVVVGDEGK